MTESIMHMTRDNTSALQEQVHARYFYRVGLLLLVLPGLAACIQSQSSVCNSGFRCPPEYICINSSNSCVPRADVIACEGKDEGEPCHRDVLDGICTMGYCASLCGDGQLQEGETCEPEPYAQSYCISDESFDMGWLGCLDTCIDYDTSSCTTFGWQRQAPEGASPNWHMLGVRALSDNDIWAVGFEAEIPEAILSRHNILEDNIEYLPGAIGKIFHYDGNGWSSSSSAKTTIIFSAIWANAPDNIYVSSVFGDILHYDGVGWHNIPSRPDFYSEISLVTSMHVRKNGDIILSMSGSFDTINNIDGAIVRYDGQAWHEMHLASGHRLWKVGGSGDDMFAVGENGIILHYDSDTEWRQMNSGTSAHLMDVWDTDSNTVFAVGEQGTILRYDGNAAGTWEPMTLTESVGSLFSVWCANHYDCHAVGDAVNNRSVIVHYDGNAQGIWRREPPRGDQPLLGVHGSARDNVVAVGLGGEVLRKQSGWMPAMEPREIEITDLWGHGSECYFGVGLDGAAVMRRGDGPWERISASSIFGFNAVWGADCNRVFAVWGWDDTGGALQYENGQWSELVIPDEVGAVPGLRDVWASPQGDVYMAGNRGVVLHYQRGTDQLPGSWQSMNIPIERDLRAIWGTSRSLYVAGQDGTVFCRDLADVEPDRSRASSWLDVSPHAQLTPIIDIWGSDDDHVFAVTSAGLVLSYKGNCASPIGEYTGVLADPSAIWGRSADDIYIINNTGEIIHYDGTGWAPIRSPTRRSLEAIWGDPAGDYLVLSSDEGINNENDGLLYELYLHPR